MRVLLANSDPATRRRFSHWLTDAGHVVLEAETTAAACALLDREPEVALVDWHIAGGGGSSLAKYLRALDDKQRVYVIASVERLQPHEIGAAYAAGADDVLATATASKEELLGRVDGLRRVRSWAALVSRTKALDFAPLFDLQKLRFWRELDAIVASELGEMLSSQLGADTARELEVPWAASVSLSLAVEKVELRFGIGLEPSIAAPFAQQILGGEASRDAFSDALRELANVAGGAIQRAAVAEGLAIKIGLPTNQNLFAAPGARTWCASTASGLRLRFAAVGLSCQARPVSRGELREGMVLASDVRNAAGMLLAAAGTYLTATTVSRLTGVLDAGVRVDVTETVPIRPSHATSQKIAAFRTGSMLVARA
jgi:DNA-binding response OmpR family regulator